MKTGGADDASGKVLVQPADIMEQIRQGDRHASRNILAARSRKLLSSGASASPAPKAKQDDATPVEPADKKPVKLSKAHCLQQQVSSIAEIAVDLRKSVELRERFGRLHEEVMLAQANSAKFQNLQKAKEIGLISDAEFMEKAKRLLI